MRKDTRNIEHSMLAKSHKDNSHSANGKALFVAAQLFSPAGFLFMWGFCT